MPKFKNVLQIKVTLKNFKPSIFRTFYFPADKGFLELHAAIQEIMGWDTEHLFAFRKGRDLEIGISSKDDFFDFNHTILDISKTKLEGFLEAPKDTITYEYDFGDSWEHKVEVQKVFSEIELPQLPFCIKGANACPIEDCGGVRGYANILELMDDKKHPDYEEMNEWYDFENLKPCQFDIDEVNDQLLDFKDCIAYHKSIVKEIKSSI
ncbi:MULTISPECIES: plasmid pRiA4b ORF-3 family protein [unclassified Flavobacterium]|jgi:hypothetical protein|uniref:plasmid pRiA4b ORF-3 family protein n=1 Tax=unclassified Flavobacterium TaxID=196869 RepID=UPI0025B8DB74|nr:MULTISPECIES: plasmid pRiA4b ORF-3 family protein [unclassified Flavobacterium]